MSSTLIKNNFSTVAYSTLERGSGSVSLSNHEERPKVVGSPPPLSMVEKLERIQERHLSDPPDTSDLKPFQISMGGNDHSMVDSTSTLSSVLMANQSKRANPSTSNHLPLAEFMSF